MRLRAGKSATNFGSSQPCTNNLFSVDSETDKLMQQIIRAQFKDQTIIAIAHKLDTVLDFDKIAFMDNGRVVEFDAPKTLLSREGSAFKSMFESFRHHSEE